MGLGIFSKFLKLLISCYASFVKIRLKGVGKGRCHYFGCGILLSTLGVGLKFRKILVQLCVMRGYSSSNLYFFWTWQSLFSAI